MSEKDTADRNFALAYYMKENKCFPKGFALQECLDFYFQVLQIFRTVILYTPPRTSSKHVLALRPGDPLAPVGHGAGGEKKY